MLKDPGIPRCSPIQLQSTLDAADFGNRTRTGVFRVIIIIIIIIIVLVRVFHISGS